MSTSFSTIMIDSGETRIYCAILCRACVFLGSRTFKYAPRRKAAPFASCLYLRILTVTYSFYWGETHIYIAIHCRACVFLGSRTFKYAPRRKAAPFAFCLYLRVLTVTFIGLFGQNAYTANTGQGALSLAGAGGARERILP